MRRALVPALALPLLVATALAQKPQVKINVDVDIVSVDVLVTTRGEPMAGLTAADFQITDSMRMVQQTARSFAEKEIRPVAMKIDE